MGAPHSLNIDWSVLNTALQLQEHVDCLGWVGVTDGIEKDSGLLMGICVVVSVVEDGVVVTVEAVAVEATSLRL